MTPGRIAALLLTVALFSLLSHPWLDPVAGSHLPTQEPGIIQPGAALLGGGTLSFLFQHKSERNPLGEPVLYVTKAGHGSGAGPGETAYLGNLLPVGVVVARINEDHDDWTLIRIFDESREHVKFSIRHWTGPTGIPAPGEIALDDVVCFYGWGNVAQLHPELRPRCARLTKAWVAESSGNGYIGFSPFVPDPGASGSPIFHYSTGQALGMLLSMNPITGEVHAIDVCSLLKRFADHGYELELATAPYAPPPEMPTVPTPYAHPVFHDPPLHYPPVTEWWSFDSPCLAG